MYLPKIRMTGENMWRTYEPEDTKRTKQVGKYEVQNNTLYKNYNELAFWSQNEKKTVTNRDKVSDLFVLSLAVI